VVVFDQHVVSSLTLPAKAAAPLIVDPNAPLVGSVALQFLQPVTGRDAEKLRGVYGIQLREADPSTATERVTLFHAPQELTMQRDLGLIRRLSLAAEAGASLAADVRGEAAWTAARARVAARRNCCIP